LKTVVLPSFAYTLVSKHISAPPINDADAFIVSAGNQFKELYGLWFEIREDDVVEVLGRIWLVTVSTSII
jgi:hypothetical protein